MRSCAEGVAFPKSWKQSGRAAKRESGSCWWRPWRRALTPIVCAAGGNGIASGGHVRGVHFQPMSSFGRCPWRSDGAPRVTLPEIAAELNGSRKGKSDGRIFIRDVKTRCVPSVPSIGETGKRWSGAGRFFLLHCGETPSAAEGPRKAKASPPGTGARPRPRQWLRGGDAFDRFLASAGIEQRFTVSCMAFQDAMTLDLERVKGCW